MPASLLAEVERMHDVKPAGTVFGIVTAVAAVSNLYAHGLARFESTTMQLFCLGDTRRSDKDKLLAINEFLGVAPAMLSPFGRQIRERLDSELASMGTVNIEYWETVPGACSWPQWRVTLPGTVTRLTL